MIKPPAKKWRLLELALKDLRKAERSKRYEVDMRDWHQPNAVCKVCFAGSVMAFSLKADRPVAMYPNRMGSWHSPLRRLDDMRQGYFGDFDPGIDDYYSAMDAIEGEGGFDTGNVRHVATKAFFDAGRPTYEGDRAKWFRTMHRCKRILKEANV